jgi:phytoene desaturase
VSKSVVVVGGGIGGIATAGLLARDGYQVTLVEAHARLGGRAGLWEKDGFRFDTGPSWYLMPEVFDHWYKLMGTSADEHLTLTKLDPGYRVYFEPQGGTKAEIIDVRASREDNLALLEEIEPGSRATMEKYLDSAKETYEIAKEYFLYTSFQSLRTLLVPAVLKRVGTLFRLLTTPIMTFAKRHTKNPKIQQLLGYPAVFLGSSPYIAPSMFHLMSYLDLEDGVLYAEGGFTRVIDSMRTVIEDHGVTVLTQARVSAITTEKKSGKAHATGVTYEDSHGVAHMLEADFVVSTTDLHHSETKLLPAELQTYPQSYWDKKMAGPSAVLLYLGVKGEVPSCSITRCSSRRTGTITSPRFLPTSPPCQTLRHSMSVSPVPPTVGSPPRVTPTSSSWSPCLPMSAWATAELTAPATRRWRRLQIAPSSKSLSGVARVTSQSALWCGEVWARQTSRLT